MERSIGMDVHAASCTLAVISQTGKRLKDFPVETNGQALVEAIRMIPGHKHLVFEEGLQSAWLYETLSPHVENLVVAGITQSRGPKSDKRDAYGLAEKLRVGNLDRAVFKAPRQFTRLRELSRIHMTLVTDTVRAQSRIKSLYRSRGVRVSGVNVYGVRQREEWQKQLSSSVQARATRLLRWPRLLAGAEEAGGVRPGSRGEEAPDRPDPANGPGLRTDPSRPARSDRRTRSLSAAPLIASERSDSSGATAGLGS